MNDIVSPSTGGWLRKGVLVVPLTVAAIIGVMSFRSGCSRAETHHESNPGDRASTTSARQQITDSKTPLPATDEKSAQGGVQSIDVNKAWHIAIVENSPLEIPKCEEAPEAGSAAVPVVAVPAPGMSTCYREIIGAIPSRDPLDGSYRILCSNGHGFDAIDPSSVNHPCTWVAYQSTSGDDVHMTITFR